MFLLVFGSTIVMVRLAVMRKLVVGIAFAIGRLVEQLTQEMVRKESSWHICYANFVQKKRVNIFEVNS
jgi:hypothetical protein